ncbi:MAG TPA: hypothetical protein VNE39_19155 [Planctomycetota bacterium]|nr:hypothetical protein [Planctomycetota bacterium]
MDTSAWFEDLPVIGKLSPEQAAAKLREVGEDKPAEELEAPPGAEAKVLGGLLSKLWPFGKRPCSHTAHAFGYLAPVAPGATSLQAIQHAGNIAPDTTLRDQRIKITLGGIRVADYPGGGMHRVLFDFYAQNQVPGNVEHLHFNSTFRVLEGERAAILGYPIFVGLKVSAEGVAFKCFTVNVKNDDDEKFLGFLDSDVFKSGLKLVEKAQPAIALLSGTALGITRSIAGRNRNVPVQDFFLGLDFTTLATSARLAEGSYLAIQVPEAMQAVWDWSLWGYNPANGMVVNKENPTQLIPYNYIVFGVSRYTGE